MKVYSALIIGAGKIGAFFDTPAGGEILTHAHAFSLHPGFHLLGFVDSNLRQAGQAAELWGGTAFASVAEAFSGNTVDVAVVAAPDEFHYPLLKELAAYPLRLVLAEKPLTRTATEAGEITGIYQAKGIPLLLNYSRRFVPEFATLREEIARGAFGRYLTGTGYYGKGTTHNGTHLVDLLRFFFGELTPGQTFSRFHDFYEDDPSCSLMLTCKNGAPFFMQAVDCRCMTVFELDLFFETKRIRILDAGYRIEYHAVRESPYFAGYLNPAPEKMIETSLAQALYHAAANCHDCLARGAAPACTGADGLRALELIAHTEESRADGARG
jgi:predicted dehydrogenase